MLDVDSTSHRFYKIKKVLTSNRDTERQRERERKQIESLPKKHRALRFFFYCCINKKKKWEFKKIYKNKTGVRETLTIYQNFSYFFFVFRTHKMEFKSNWRHSTLHCCVYSVLMLFFISELYFSVFLFFFFYRFVHSFFSFLFYFVSSTYYIEYDGVMT